MYWQGLGSSPAWPTVARGSACWEIPDESDRIERALRSNRVIEETAMTTTTKDAQQRSAAAAVKAERALDKAAAMQEYEADELALRANTERLRALRLAREAESLQVASTRPPSKTKAAPEPTISEPTKKKAVKRVAAPKRAGGKPPELS
jgi:hypothetical protein